MWPHIRFSLLNTVDNIQRYHQSFSQTSRNLGIAFAAIGTLLCMAAFWLVAYLHGSGMERLASTGLLTVYTFAEGSEGGVHFMVLAAGLLAIHMYKGGTPPQAAHVFQQLNGGARSMLGWGMIAILFVFIGYEWIQLETFRDSSDISTGTFFSVAVMKWLSVLVNNLLQATTALMTVLLFVRGAGRQINEDVRPQIFAAATILFFWIKILQIILYLVNAIVAAPIIALLPISEMQYLVSAMVAFIVYIFGMIPGAAIAASVIRVETELQLDGASDT